MKSKDLMVGDFILVERNEGIYGGPVWKQPGKVLEIYQDEIKVLFADENGDNEYDEILTFLPHEVDGLPLTPEILEKNGFNLRENIVVGGPKFVHEQEDGRTEIVIWLQDGMFMEVRKNIYYEDEICYTLPVPFFVHELQHCLKLCGIDKTIEL